MKVDHNRKKEDIRENDSTLFMRFSIRYLFRDWGVL
jgi:hypothetical protein